jgi:hypothetical protein
MSFGRKQSVGVLTARNWRDSVRTRRSCGIWMSARIEDAGNGRYRGVHGFPEQSFGADRAFESLDEALARANTDGGGVLLIATDD